MDTVPRPSAPPAEARQETDFGFSVNALLRVEHTVYVLIGALLALTAVFALIGAAASAWTGIIEWRSGSAIPTVIERLLFVLMITEILHTVRISIRSGSLTCEPFLVVGLIASIRRVLVITLESTEGTKDKMAAPEMANLVPAPMVELCVLALLIIVMVVSLYLLGRNARERGAGSA